MNGIRIVGQMIRFLNSAPHCVDPRTSTSKNLFNIKIFHGKKFCTSKTCIASISTLCKFIDDVNEIATLSLIGMRNGDFWIDIIYASLVKILLAFLQRLLRFSQNSINSSLINGTLQLTEDTIWSEAK